MIRQLVREFEARIDDALQRQADQFGIADLALHREQHERIDRVLPELERTFLPWARAQQQLTQRRLAFWDGVRKDVVTWAIRGAIIFVIASVYYGAVTAVARMVG